METSQGSAIHCTAEAFGFGPAAALHQILPHLKAQGHPVHYVGYGLTLDMHTERDYVSVHACNVYTPEGVARLRALLRPGDLFFSVSDVRAAEVAKQAGCRVALYDPLTWFRRPLPAACRGVDLYVCPEFFGVRERIASEHLVNARVVAPLMPRRIARRLDASSGVVVNLGGLKTPFSEVEQCAVYAQLIVDAVVVGDVGPPQVLVSHKIGERLRRCAVRTATPAQARDMLAQSRVVFATPGLGNILDVAGLAVPACFLPPVSDSQGQQLVMLRQRGLMPWAIDWHQITGEAPIDYWASKPEIMARIAASIAATGSRPAARGRLEACVAEVLHEDPSAFETVQQQFVDTFGRDDGSQAAALIAEVLH